MNTISVSSPAAAIGARSVGWRGNACCRQASAANSVRQLRRLAAAAASLAAGSRRDAGIWRPRHARRSRRPSRGPLINLRLADLVELPVDRGQAGVQAFVVGRIGGVADADQQAVGREQPAAAAAIDRLAGRGVVRLALVLVDRRDVRRAHARIGTLVAADGEGAVAGPHGRVPAERPATARMPSGTRRLTRAMSRSRS